MNLSTVLYYRNSVGPARNEKRSRSMVSKVKENIMKVLLTSTLAVVFLTLSIGAAAQQNWPEAIAMPIGFEGEGIELGKGHEFFVGANSFSSLFGSYPVSELAGAI